MLRPPVCSSFFIATTESTPSCSSEPLPFSTFSDQLLESANPRKIQFMVFLITSNLPNCHRTCYFDGLILRRRNNRVAVYGKVNHAGSLHKGDREGLACNPLQYSSHTHLAK